MSTRPTPAPPDLQGVEGDHVLRGWTRPRVWGLVGALTLSALGVLGGVLLRDRYMLVLGFVILLPTPVSIWRTRHREVTTTIAPEGITIDRGTGPPGRTRIAWVDAREVYVAGAWQAHSTVRTSAHREVPLPGVDRTCAAKLAEALRARR